MLDRRESFKLERQRKQYDDRIKDCKNVTIHMPAVRCLLQLQKLSYNLRCTINALVFCNQVPIFWKLSQRKPSCSVFLFKNLRTDLLDYHLLKSTTCRRLSVPNLSSGWKFSFFKLFPESRYFEHRENTVFAEEEKRLHDDECELKKVEQAEKDLNLLIEKVRNLSSF